MTRGKPSTAVAFGIREPGRRSPFQFIAAIILASSYGVKPAGRGLGKTKSRRPFVL